jgi:hypothetical protein
MHNYVRASDNLPSRLIGIDDMTPFHLQRENIVVNSSSIDFYEKDTDEDDLFCYEVMSD